MRRSVLPALILAATALFVLSGCGALGDLVSSGEPDRDEQGAVTEAATNDVMALEVGDCLDSEDLDGRIEEVPFVPCAEAHDSEVYASTELEGTEYPGDTFVEKKSDAFCYDQFASFVGLAYEESVLDYFPMYPLEDGWNSAGDREVLCLVVDLDGGVTGTMQASAR